MSVSIIPESAPFTEEQRAWLNGFLAGWVGMLDTGDGNGPPAPLGRDMKALIDSSTSATTAEEEEEFPWHDAGLALEERLQLAEAKPFKRRLMAAMAQLDCGACGYICQTYSEAIAAGEEKNLTLCSPGGKETAKVLKRLVKEQKDAPAAESKGHPVTNGQVTVSDSPTGYSRANPAIAKVKSCHNLNRPGSSKQTSHVVIDLEGTGLEYQVGDSLGVYPTNCPELVDHLLVCLDAPQDTSLRQDLMEKYCLRTVSDELLEVLANAASDAEQKDALLALIDSDELDGLDVLDVLHRASSAKIASADLVACLMELTPRLYSIASSLRAHPGEVHLTVGRATTTVGNREYKGVASTMFADRIQAGDTLRVYVHASHGFTVPHDATLPMIMVGPGTGIAPFRAFLEERQATGAKGKNWLFFGDQHAATDFLYEDELPGLLAHGKLSVAFSRDQEEKIYVQDRMREEGAELFRWLEEGAYFFVCGDAKRMAVDVDRALQDLIAEHGGRSEADAKGYVEQLKTDKRYVRDVY